MHRTHRNPARHSCPVDRPITGGRNTMRRMRGAAVALTAPYGRKRSAHFAGCRRPAAGDTHARGPKVIERTRAGQPRVTTPLPPAFLLVPGRRGAGRAAVGGRRWSRVRAARGAHGTLMRRAGEIVATLAAARRQEARLPRVSEIRPSRSSVV